MEDAIFPNFQFIHTDSKRIIEAYVDGFLPYSDYYFFSLWSWGYDVYEYSFLHGNLVIKFIDYMSGEPFFSFLGNNFVEETANELLLEAKERSYAPYLKLIPQETVDCMFSQKKDFLIKEDQDNFDYILNTEKLSTFSGSFFHQKRKHLNRFRATYSTSVEHHILKTEEDLLPIFLVLDRWKEEKVDVANHAELEAIYRIHEGIHLFSLRSLLVLVDDHVIGFAIYEILESGVAICSYMKADYRYKGVTEYMYNELGKFLWEQGIHLLNIEQDLGLANLRRAKSEYGPTFLKKYTVLLPEEVR